MTYIPLADKRARARQPQRFVPQSRFFVDTSGATTTMPPAATYYRPLAKPPPSLETCFSPPLVTSHYAIIDSSAFYQ